MRRTESGEKGGGSGKEVAEEIRSCFRARSLHFSYYRGVCNIKGDKFLI